MKPEKVARARLCRVLKAKVIDFEFYSRCAEKLKQRRDII